MGKKETASLSSRMAELKASSVVAISSAEAKVSIDEIREAINTLKNSFDSVDSEYNGKLKLAEESFKKDLLSLESKHLKELADIKESNRSELERLESLLKQQRQETENAEAMLVAHKDSLDSELETIRVEYDEELKRLETLVDQLRVESDGKDARIAEIQKELDAAKARIAEMSESQSVDSKALNELKAEYELKLRDLNHKLRDLNIEKERAELNLAEAERNREAALEDLEDTQGELAIALEEVDQLKVRISELEDCQKCEMYRSEIALKDTAHAEEMEAVESELASVREEVSAGEAKVQELDAANKALENSLDMLKSELEAANRGKASAEKHMQKVDLLNKKALEKYQSLKKKKGADSVSEEYSAIVEDLDRLRDLLEPVDDSGNLRELVSAVSVLCQRAHETYETQRVESEKNRKMAEEAVLLSEKTIKGSKGLEDSAEKVVSLETALKKAEQDAAKRAQSLLEAETRLDAERMRAESSADQLAESENRVRELEEAVRMYEESMAAGPVSAEVSGAGSREAVSEFSLKEIREQFSVRSILADPTFLEQQSKLTQQRILDRCSWLLLVSGEHSDSELASFLDMYESRLTVYHAAAMRVRLGRSEAVSEPKNAKSTLDKMLICAMLDVAPSACLPPKTKCDFKSATKAVDVAVRAKSKNVIQLIINAKDLFSGIASRRDDVVAAAISSCHDDESTDIVRDLVRDFIAPKVDKLFVRAVSADNKYMFSILVSSGLDVNQSRIMHLSKANAVSILDALPDMVPSVLENAVYLAETMEKYPGRVVKFLKDNRDSADKVHGSIITKALELKSREVISALRSVIPVKFNDVFVQNML